MGLMLARYSDYVPGSSDSICCMVPATIAGECMDFCTTSEKRRFPRVNVEGLFACLADSNCKLQVVDINLDGLAVAGEALADLLPNQQISVSLWRGEQLLLRICKARVAHCNAFKAGINFLELDVDSKNTLFSVVISALARSMD